MLNILSMFDIQPKNKKKKQKTLRLKHSDQMLQGVN